MSLTNEQKALPSGAVLPSGEANYYDFSQSHEYHDGSGINATYPSPDTFVDESGVIKTYAPDGSPYEGSSVFSIVANSGTFSNASGINIQSITDFTIFNPYIHFLPDQTGSGEILIPYISDYNIAKPFNPYNF